MYVYQHQNKPYWSSENQCQLYKYSLHGIKLKSCMHLQPISESTLFQCNNKLWILQTLFPVNDVRQILVAIAHIADKSLLTKKMCLVSMLLIGSLHIPHIEIWAIFTCGSRLMTKSMSIICTQQTEKEISNK